MLSKLVWMMWIIILCHLSKAACEGVDIFANEVLPRMLLSPRFAKYLEFVLNCSPCGWVVDQQWQLINTFCNERAAFRANISFQFIYFPYPVIVASFRNLGILVVENRSAWCYSCLYEAGEFHSHPGCKLSAIRSTKHYNWLILSIESLLDYLDKTCIIHQNILKS